MTDPAAIFRTLADGDLEILGLLPMASNATLLTRVHGELEVMGVYKPQRGETPLWDFPDGTLCYREHAAWVVSEQLGWGLVPPSVLRDGPAGFGVLQLFIDHDPNVDLQSALERQTDDFRRMALFDVIINNADRKGGHCLVDPDERVWGVDHGVCFHYEPKLRTIIWAFEADPIPKSPMVALESFVSRGAAGDELLELLTTREVAAVRSRSEQLLSSGVFPLAGRGHNVPWPPW